jgi:hypothetical protein
MGKRSIAMARSKGGSVVVLEAGVVVDKRGFKGGSDEEVLPTDTAFSSEDWWGHEENGDVKRAAVGGEG